MDLSAAASLYLNQPFIPLPHRDPTGSWLSVLAFGVKGPYRPLFGADPPRDHRTPHLLRSEPSDFFFLSYFLLYNPLSRFYFYIPKSFGCS